MKLKIVMILVLITLINVGPTMAENIKIGVLAKNGPVKALAMWKATGDYLSAEVSGKSFEIIPLGFDAVNPAIEKGEVDFFLINSSMFVTAKVNYGATAVATMINSRQGKPLQSFGGVIFCDAENDSINSLADLKGKNFMAVKKSSFGGWQMAYKEFVDNGLQPTKDFTSLVFGGKHDNVVLAIQNGVADAGTVRTDTLERMQAAGTISMEDFKILVPKEHADFPFVVSTKLYPEWPLAKTKGTSDALAKEVVEVLTKLQPTDVASKKAKIIGWVAPLDYGGIEDLQKSLKIGAYAK